MERFLSEECSIVEWALDSYGQESHERDIEQVQEAIVFLTCGNPDKLLEFILLAKRDYRDILHWYHLERAKVQAE